MKRLFTLIFILHSLTTKSQCIVGDCRSGYGEAYESYGNHYEGNFLRGKFHGEGKMDFADGKKYVGYWFNNKFNGKGAYYYSNGKKYYDGNWKNHLRDGYGVAYYENGKVGYEGTWVSDHFGGDGTLYKENGDKYVGEFLNGKFNGKGTFYYVDGRVKNGMWQNDNYIDGSGSTSTADTGTIQMIKTEGGVYEIPVFINGVLKISFIFDSGAADVSISSDVALTLIKTGTVTSEDFIGTQKYQFANGQTVTSKVFLIRELQIGNRKLTDVKASISESIDSPMLLGQSVLQKFGKFTIDNNAHTLTIE